MSIEKSRAWRRYRASDWVFQALNYTFAAAVLIACLYPLYYLILVAVSDSAAVNRGEVRLIPVGFTLQYFRDILTMDGMGHAFFISAARTVLGTLITLAFTSMFAYTVTKPALRLRKAFYRLTVFTMYASAGLIPWVVVYTRLGLKNSFLLYILPGAIYPFGMVLIKTYIEQLPDAVEEAARVDGAGYFATYTRIVLPLCLPVLAALAVFTSVGQWNSFQDNFFLVQSEKLRTVQMYLYDILKRAEAAAANARRGDMTMVLTAPPNAFTVKATTAIVTILPILAVYPFLQRFFVKGILLGAVKG